ncbi:MAG: molybdopterin-dependent oxidoreductase, partial [Bryobacterales bacterium]|nr:molybdopterin-dependent oxidoreductase [Bryobacterales bacterium]
MVETKASVCALDCPDCCSVLVTIENGKGTKLKGNPDHPITRGFLCAKVTQYLEREYHPDRLLYPAKRTGAKGEGRFTRISWDEALDTIATRLKAIAASHGTEALLPYSYAGTMGVLNNAGMDRRFFHRFGASRLDRTICSSAGMFGMNEAYSGMRYGTEPEQFAHSKLILAWGANILGCNVHLWPFIQEARRNGAKLYVIDPVKNRTGAAADRWYPIQPGTDLALALGLMHVIFAEGLEDRAYLDSYARNTAELKAHVRDYTPQRVAELTGIPAEDIVALAREYATTKPAAIRLNYGVQRSERGGRAIQSIAYLSVITGSWQHVGGGLQLSTSQAYQFNLAGLERPDFQKKSLGRDARIINMTEFGKALNDPLDPPVKAVVVYNSNPMAIAPDQHAVRKGLLREDLFTVVLEQFQTDTADFADILLPVTTFLEHTDLYRSYGHHYVQLARPALPRPGEVRSNVDIFRALAERLGFDEPEFHESEDDMIRATLASGHPFLEGITFDKLEREGSVRLNVASAGAPFQPYAKGGFGTPDGKCEFKPETLAYEPPIESRRGDAALTARYPLELVASKNDNSMNSTFGHRDSVHAETRRLWMHTADAVKRGIEDGDAVRVFNNRGSVLMEAYVNGGVRPGAVRAPSVSWTKRMPNQQGINTL